jgi:hypothetical protein
MIRSPFPCVPSHQWPRLLSASAIATALVGLLIFGVVRAGPGLPALYALVFAGTPERAAAVLGPWDESDRLWIAFANGLDYLFGVLLFGSVSLGCTYAALRAAEPRRQSLGFALAWAAWCGVLLDVPENTSYLAMVRGTVSQPWPALALVSTSLRHLLLGTCLAYIGFNARSPRVGRPPGAAAYR